MPTTHGTDSGAPNAVRSSASHGVDEKVLTYPDGTQIVQRFTNGPAPAGPTVSASVTVSAPRPRTVEGHVLPDGRFWRVDVPELDMDVPVRLLEHAERHTTATVASRLQLDPTLVAVRLLRNGRPFTPPSSQAAQPASAPTITYR